MNHGADSLRTLRALPRSSDSLFVLGNGPSLGLLDLGELRTLDAIGMNAAYRYWRQESWFPSYYCCMDHVVLESHREAVRQMVREREALGIRAFFLRDVILEFYPDLVDEPSVIIADHWALASRWLQAEPVTTGSYAALFGLLMGYRRLYLLGVDCNYTEQVRGAAHRRGTVLEMTETPVSNPNYFYPAYQQAGDRFNVPNPSLALHRRSWIVVSEAAADLGVEVLNCGPDSELGLFPYRSLRKALQEAA